MSVLRKTVIAIAAAAILTSGCSFADVSVTNGTTAHQSVTAPSETSEAKTKAPAPSSETSPAGTAPTVSASEPTAADTAAPPETSAETSAKETAPEKTATKETASESPKASTAASTEAPRKEDFAKTVTVSFEATDDVLINGGKGFVYYGGSSKEADELSYLFYTGYTRFNWADIEPEEGKYDFGPIDELLEYYSGIGKKFAFGVMCCNSSSSKEYVTPKFVFDDGAKYEISRKSDGKIQYIPNWEDGVFLKHLDRLVKALGERYDGNENIAFIDIRSYGNWGEQHLFGLDVDENYSWADRIEPEFLLENYIKPYEEAFPNTLLVNPIGHESLHESYGQLIDDGIALRRDGIVKYTDGLDVCAKAYGKVPVVFEFSDKYSHFTEDGMSNSEFNGRLEEAIEEAKPTYIELDTEWYEENREYCEELANRMGYYFRLKRAEYYPSIKRGSETRLELCFANDGTAPIYSPCSVFIGLLGENGELLEKYPTDIDPKDWQPAASSDESVRFTVGSGVSAGKYYLAVGLFEDEDGEPSYLLGNEGRAENSRWYIIGSVSVY